jgi:membrane glycosyltransferase
MSGAALLGTGDATPTELVVLWLWALCMLFLPRVLGLFAVVLRGEQAAFGGMRRLLVSACFETALALMQAPVRMLAHSLFVLVALTGMKLHWTSPPREASGLGWSDAAARLMPLTSVVAALAAAVAWVNPAAVAALLPVAVPLLLSVPLTVLTSHVELGAALRARGLLLIPEEAGSPPVLQRARLHARHAARLLRTA